MAKLSREKGTTSQILHVFIQDSSSTTGAGLAGLVYDSASLACRYINAGGTLSGAITLQTITTLGTYEAPTANTNMRFKEVSSASPSQGVYEIHLHNDWMNLTGGSLVIMLAGATNMAQFRLEIDLQADVNVTHVAGTVQTAGDLATMITAVDDFVNTEVAAIKTKTDFLPSVTAGAAGGLMIAGSNAATTFATLTVTGASIFTGNVSYAAGITITQSTVNGHGISITGNGIGHGVKFIGGDTGSGAHFVGGATSGHAVNTEAASGYSGFNGVGVGGGYGFRGSMEFLPAALIGGRINADATAISGDSVAADRLETMLDGAGGNTLSAAITGNITGNLSGSVGSVTGAVGSVTGDVGGNVTGSVGSIASNGINNNSLHSNACSKITDSGIQRGASNWENNSDDRSLGWAISKLVNKIDLNAAGDTLTIRKSNDSTALFTQAVTTSGGAAPVVSLDTTG